MMKIWSPKAWKDYENWIDTDIKTVKRINKLLKDIERCAPGSPTVGKAEKLKYSNQGLLSIRIDKKNRLIYRIEQEGLYIISCCGHYD
ncbi:Txe/YoeB family addiction module toxin [uncultured Succinatimonas sp.]|uniref:Txe/YoeB family addiction module toxin n=1 Tax=uncultured Succinatimonas sp. TaxID=1262973 RepID=UPI0025EB96A8|nr:Txe/YoeB family addiction module toxin [uncultured Succinatimonas sp.]